MKFAVLISVVSAFLFSSCNSDKDEDPKALFDSIKVGMSTGEVEKVLGKPTSKVDEISGELMIWEMDDGSSIAVSVDQGGKVTSTSRSEK